MSDKDARFATRRNVIKATAGAGVAGLAARPAAAASSDPMLGPLADVSTEKKLGFEEYRRVLNGDDNGAVRRTAGTVRDERTFVGDSRDVGVETMEREFAGGLSADDTVEQCFDTGFFTPNFCVELTVEVTDAGVEVLLVVAGYPIVDVTLPKEKSVSYDFDVPLVDVSGSVSLAAELVDRCTVELSADASLTAFGSSYEFDETVTESGC